MSDLTPRRWLVIPPLQERPDLVEAGADRLVAEIRDRDIEGLLWSWEEEVAPLIAATHASTGLPVCPILPNMATFAREARDRGQIGALVACALKMSPSALIRMMFGALPQAPDAARKDFATALVLLAETELARFRPFGADALFLSAQMADLAVTFDNRRLLEKVARLARRYRLAFGVQTFNLGQMAARLDAWGVSPDAVLAPLNACGWLMYPDPATAEASARRLGGGLICFDPEAGGAVDLCEARSWLAERGVHALALRSVPLIDD